MKNIFFLNQATLKEKKNTLSLTLRKSKDRLKNKKEKKSHLSTNGVGNQIYLLQNSGLSQSTGKSVQQKTVSRRFCHLPPLE